MSEFPTLEITEKNMYMYKAYKKQTARPLFVDDAAQLD